MSDTPSADPSGGYVLGRTDAETRRLMLQHQIYGPLTRQFLTTAGVSRGMKVLDLGPTSRSIIATFTISTWQTTSTQSSAAGS